MEMARFWYVEEIEKLIELVSVRPCIWNADDPDYTDPSSRNEAFEAIAKQMGLQTEVVRSKFRNLRAQYFRIYRNPVQRNNPKKWIHFDALRFLNEDCNQQAVVPKAMSISDQDEIPSDLEIETDDIIEEETLDECCNEDLYTALDEHVAESSIHADNQKITIPKKDVVSKAKTKPQNNKHKPKTLVMKATANEKDAHTIFGEYVANELRSLQHNKKMQQSLKCAILKAIYETNEALVS